MMRGVTPFLDLLFILLFSLLALSDAKRAKDPERVRIRLPRVEPADGTEGPALPAIVIEIDATSRVRMAGDPRPVEGPADLDRRLERRLGSTLPEEFEVEIQADGRARHGVGVALLQHLRRRGFAGVTLLALGDADATWTEGGR